MIIRECEVESAAMQLSRSSRARLAQMLLASLDDEDQIEADSGKEIKCRVREIDAAEVNLAPEPDPRHDAAWAAELRERILAVKSGEMKLITEEEAQAEAEELLR